MRNDYLDYLMHSAKGSTWRKHKYVKKIGDKYYYGTSEQINNLEKANTYKTTIEKDRAMSAAERARQQRDNYAEAGRIANPIIQRHIDENNKQLEEYESKINNDSSLSKAEKKNYIEKARKQVEEANAKYEEQLEFNNRINKKTVDELHDARKKATKYQ